MATKNFTQFNTATPLTTSDYVVGYKADGSAEIKTQVQSILNLKNETDSQTLSFNDANKNLTISLGNTVSLSSLSDTTIINSVSSLLTPLTLTNTLTGQLVTNSTFDSYRTDVANTTGTFATSNFVQTNFFPLTGGTITGTLTATTIFTTGSGNVLIDRGNYRTNTSSTIILGANSDQHLRFRAGGDTNNEIRMTILSSGEVGIGTSLTQTRSQRLSIINGDSSNISGLVATVAPWLSGTPQGWLGSNNNFTVFQNGSNYIFNPSQLATGPGSSSFRQNLGTTSTPSDIILGFDYLNPTVASWSSGTLNVGIFTSTFTLLASSFYTVPGTYTLSANNVPINTEIVIGFWTPDITNTPALDNVGISQANNISLTVNGAIKTKNLIVEENTTITGNLSVQGTTTYVDTSVQVTSAMFIDTNSTETALRITQTGSGDVIRVEDTFNPDVTPFIVKTDGLVGVGTSAPNSNLTVVGNISATNTLYASGGIVNSLYAGPMAGNLSLNTPISAVSGVYINPVNGYTGIQTLSSIAPLDVRGTMVYVTSAATGTTPSNIRVRDNYAYVTNYGNNSLWIYDLSRTTLSFVASASTSTQPQGLYINGRYAYVVTSNSSSSVLQIFDISQTATPILLSTTTIGAGQNAFEVVVQGNYAFVLTNVSTPGTNCYIIAYDISNPYAPNKVFSLQPTSNSVAHTLTVQGKYVYWCSTGLGSVRIYRIDTTDLRRTPAIETVYTVSGGSTGGIAIRGKYLYVTIANSFYVVDITTGTLVGNTGIMTTAVGLTFFNNIVLQDNYAYVGTLNSFIKVDITDPFSPRVVQSTVTNIGVTSFPSNFAIQGRYAYLPDRTYSRINTIDLGGAYIQQLEAGGIKTDSLDVVGNTVLGSDLDVEGGAAFGQGFKSYKDSNIQGSLYVTSLTSMSASTYFSVASSSGSTLFAITSTGKIQINTPSTLEFNTQAVQPGVTLTTSTSCLLITVNGTELKIPLLS